MVNETARLTFVADSRDVKSASKDLDNMSKAAARGERSAKRMARGIKSAFAGIGVGLIIQKIVQNTIEQERVTAQLNATLRSTGRFSQETSEALLAQGRALQQLTVYGDEAVISAQNVLLTFRRIGSENFPRATEATLDLATAMGTDLRSAAIQVGKALEDPATQMTYLSRAGITFTQVQKDMVRELQKSGDLAGAQAIVLKELETQFGGSARAARDTFGGALKSVQNAFGDLLEGDSGSGGVTGATAALNDLADTLNSPEIKEGFANITSGVAKLVGLFAKASAGVANFSAEVKEQFARSLGVEAGDSVEEITDRIRVLQAELEHGRVSADPRASFLYLFSRGPSEERRANIQAEIEKLQFMLELFENKPKSDSGTLPAVPGLDTREPITPIEIDEKGIRAVRKHIAQLEREIREAGQAASEELAGALNDLTAQMGGETAAAGTRLGEVFLTLAEHERTLAETGQLTAEKEQQLASARALATQQYEEEIEAIREAEAARAAELTVAEQLIEDLKFELELLGLSNEEKEKAIALRYAGADATDAEREAIARLLDQIQQESESVRIMDDIRRAAEGELSDVIGGYQSAGDAAQDFLERMRRIASDFIAEKLIEKILGGFGSTDGGILGDLGSGGGFGGFISSLFGSGRALGGPVFPGRIHPVTERGEPELLTVGRRQYLITGSQQGQVQPVSNNTDNRRSTVINNVTITRPVSRETGVQIANEISRTQRRAEARNR